MSYPKWIYHKSQEPKVVKSAEEHTAHGTDWQESPLSFEESSEALAEEKTKPRRAKKES